MRIGDLAREAEVSVDTLRYYERRGLVAPDSRSPSGYREFGQEAVDRVRFIRRAKALGFTLDEASDLLRLSANGGACASVRARAAERLTVIAAKLQAMQDLHDALKALIARCDADAPLDGCPILGAMREVE